MSGTGVDLLVRISKFIYSILYITNQCLVVVYSITGPCYFVIHLAFCHFFRHIFNNADYLSDDLRIFMSCIQREIHIIRNNSMYIRMAYNLTCCIYKFRIQFIQLFMQIFQHFGCCKQRIFSVFHRSCSCMICLTVSADTIVYHTKDTGYDTDIISCCFQDRSLLDMKFKHRFVFLRIQTVFDITFVTGCV